MPLFSLLAFALLCWFSCAATALAQPTPASPRIWSGLILATNGDHPGQPPERLRKVAGKLKNIFGYNQFSIIGESSEKLDDPNERWLIPSKEFYMSVKNGAGPGGNHPMKIVLFENRRRLAELQAHLGPDSPLFIRGPLYDRGQLLIVLREADPSEFAASEVKPAAAPVPAYHPALPREYAPLYTPPPYLARVPGERLRPLPYERFGPLYGDPYSPFYGERPFRRFRRGYRQFRIPYRQ